MIPKTVIAMLIARLSSAIAMNGMVCAGVTVASPPFIAAMKLLNAQSHIGVMTIIRSAAIMVGIAKFLTALYFSMG